MTLAIMAPSPARVWWSAVRPATLATKMFGLPRPAFCPKVVLIDQPAVIAASRASV